ncbi:MAG: formylglycine-generating enzyme family protein [Gammaproteobacteria bacterium]|nr:formylglycine-generating enzyme family protein [Gammaproteobacteria bacterium]MDH5728723.1 formylglycine-generating enzyme family protein [Gammaproteobacteria bacterium]
MRTQTIHLNILFFLALVNCELAANEIDMQLIPAGIFTMGSEETDNKNRAAEFGSEKPWYADEKPARKINLPAFYIDKYEVSNEQYREYILKNQKQPTKFWLEKGYHYSFDLERLQQAPMNILKKMASTLLQLDMDTRHMNQQQLVGAILSHYNYFSSLPVTFISWQEAADYCQAQGKRLPSEAEWEKTARGDSQQRFVWGEQWEPGLANIGEEEWPMGVAPVGSYKTDQSPHAVFDLAGNVSEWTNDWYQAYPGSDYVNKFYGQKHKVARGGGWSAEGHYALELYYRAAYRINLNPDRRYNDVGFRCAKDAIK